MAVALRAAGPITFGGAPAYPTNEPGDVLVLSVGYQASSAPAAPAGWTLLRADVSTTSPGYAVYWRRVTTPLSGTQAIVNSTAQISAFSGAAQAQVPVGFIGGRRSGSQSSSFQTLSGTYLGPLLVGYTWNNNRANTINQAFSNVGAASEVLDANSAATYNAMSMATAVAPTESGTSMFSGSFSPSVAAAAWAIYLLAEPEPSGPVYRSQAGEVALHVRP